MNADHWKLINFSAAPRKTRIRILFTNHPRPRAALVQSAAPLCSPICAACRRCDATGNSVCPADDDRRKNTCAVIIAPGAAACQYRGRCRCHLVVTAANLLCCASAATAAVPSLNARKYDKRVACTEALSLSRARARFMIICVLKNLQNSNLCFIFLLVWPLPPADLN